MKQIHQPVLNREERALKRRRVIEEQENPLSECMNESKYTFFDRVQKINKNLFKKPYHKLSFSHRKKRMDVVAMYILAACLDKNEVKKEGIEYVIGNMDVAHEVLNIIHGLRDRLSLKLGIDLVNDINEPNACPLPEHEEEEINFGHQAASEAEIRRTTGSGP